MRTVALTLFALLSSITAAYPQRAPLDVPIIYCAIYSAGVWGFADLHTHPASHLAFGADQNGENGLFWGKPGLELSSSSTPAAIASDLPACVPDNHSNSSDPVTQKEHAGIISKLDKTTGYMHESKGNPDFVSWPHALSVEHQQMHITAIRRAYDGGLRLLIASAADNQVISDLWHIGFNVLGNPIPTPDSSFDFNSAVKQLTFMQSLVAANSSWMQIVTSPSEARQAINNNKLAVILSLEMDSLSTDQILTLVSAYQVRQVIPVHLADNSFGGSALYDDLWNGNTYFLNGSFFDIVSDPCLSFRLGEPEVMVHDAVGGINLGNNADTAAALDRYNQVATGHENTRRLNSDEFKKLMRAGLLIDIAHMGKLTADDALGLAEQFQYPLMDSHTTLRDDGDGSCTGGIPPDNNLPVRERDLTFSQAKRIAALGGVIGFGTSGLFGQVVYPDAVEKWLKDYQVALNVMSGRGVALGTDTNGLSQQILINKYGYVTTYPITIASEFNPPPGVLTPPLSKFQLGSRVYDFTQDGLANYGLLPDFLQAVSEHPDFQAVPAPSLSANLPPLNVTPNPTAINTLAALYHSAEDTIEMWERVEVAAQNAALCAPGLTLCHGACVDTMTDRNNCGACGIRCNGTCTNGTCGGPPPPVCNPPTHCCGEVVNGRCVPGCTSRPCP